MRKKPLFLLILIALKRLLILLVKGLPSTEELLGDSYLFFFGLNSFIIFLFCCVWKDENACRVHELLAECWPFHLCAYFADIDGQVDMKRICGITAVEERAKQEKGVKVLSLNTFIYFFGGDFIAIKVRFIHYLRNLMIDVLRLWIETCMHFKRVHLIGDDVYHGSFMMMID